jgi:hypothetical protein
MAAIDKIYGSREEWKELRVWLNTNRWDFMKNMYTEPEISGPLANFTEEQDKWLWENCPLFFVRNRLKEQYKEYDLEGEYHDS